jgi:hypothetical protein
VIELARQLPLRFFPLDLKVEQGSRVENGTIFVETDNPRVEVTTRLITVHADWANGTVPQELARGGNGWRINNADMHLLVSNGEDEATDHLSRAGSLDGTAYAWPTSEGEWHGNENTEVTVMGRIRVGYKPLTVRLGVSLPRPGPLAPNSSEPFQIALDPDILLVPVEAVLFKSSSVSMSDVTVRDQMVLWDQMPVIGADTNFRSTDGSTGEDRFVLRAWEVWPTLSSDGVYRHQGWISPDSIWGKAGVAFRLVNYIEIETDDEHTFPTTAGITADTRLRENQVSALSHSLHIDGVLTVVIMGRIAPPDVTQAGGLTPELGEDLSSTCLGISWNVTQKSVILAHEIGHAMGLPHNDIFNNVMNPPGGTDVTPEQIESARKWAKGFSNFWRHP